MTLDDKVFRNDQLRKRQNSRYPSNTVGVKVGDTVKLKNKHYKQKEMRFFWLGFWVCKPRPEGLNTILN